jgi:hypothetical protein
MAMLRILLIGLTCLSLFGCILSQDDRLPEETKFREIRSPADVAGVFRNRGFSYSGDWHPLLSDVLFPNRKFDVPPGEIRFRSKMPTGFRCEAISKGRVIAVTDLVESRDFRITDGGIRLDPKFSPGIDVSGVGIGGESSVIRLVDTRYIVLSQRQGGFGLMLFILPFGGMDSRDALFEKLE